jgi:[ribosomal protein S18]-alanine N-acetyltransferase
MVRVLRLQPDADGDLIALHAACFPFERPRSAAAWRRLLGPSQERGSALALGIRTREGLLIAAIIILTPARSGWARVHSLAVDAAHRRQGLATVLLHRALQRTGRKLMLEVEVGNHAARSLYRHAGFVLGERLPAYYSDGTDGLRYRTRSRDR